MLEGNSKSMKAWFASGEPWIWMNAAAVGISIVAVIGVLALIAVPLARFRPGASHYYPLWIGVLVFTVYFNLLGTGQLWIEQGRLPDWLGLWWVHGLLLGVAVAWIGIRRGRPLRRVTA